jgi:transcriptional regulator of arginine metabolism
MKNSRHKLILELIEKNEIDTQESLIKHLEALGVHATQTTISRDIRELKIVKGLTARGSYKYVSPNTSEGGVSFRKSFTDAIVKVERACNIVVLKTLSGMANAIAVSVDALNLSDIVGSVAGDDTILLVCHDNDSAQYVKDKINSTFGIE